MMWVVRAGQGAVFYKKFLDEKRIFIPWDGFCSDLKDYKCLADYRSLVEKEKNTDNRTSVSNWAGQLYSFVWEINIGDYVLIPSKLSQTYTLCRVVGEYTFNGDEKDGLFHSRSIELITSAIPKKTMSQELIYSLGAYRTIFKVKREDEVLRTIDKWKEQQRNG